MADSAAAAPAAPAAAADASRPKITQAQFDDMIKNEVPSRFVREWFGELLTKEDRDALINNPSSFPLGTTKDFDAGPKRENIDGKMSWLREHDGEMAKFGVAGNGKGKDKNFVIPLKQSYVVVVGPYTGLNTMKYTQTITNVVSSEFGFAESFELSYAPPGATGGVGGKGTFSATQKFGFSTSKASTIELTASVNPRDTIYALAPSVTYAVIQTWSSFGWGKYQVKKVFKATGMGVTVVAM